MNKFNIFESRDDLQIFEDERGVIADIFYNTTINHVAFISSRPNTLRGNHYHALTTQHIFITDGSLEYWYAQNLSSPKASFEICQAGDLVTSEPGEIHALKIGPNGCKFIAFSTGLRGGLDYESDTFRVPDITNLS